MDCISSPDSQQEKIQERQINLLSLGESYYEEFLSFLSLLEINDKKPEISRAEKEEVLRRIQGFLFFPTILEYMAIEKGLSRGQRDSYKYPTWSSMWEMEKVSRLQEIKNEIAGILSIELYGIFLGLDADTVKLRGMLQRIWITCTQSIEDEVFVDLISEIRMQFMPFLIGAQGSFSEAKRTLLESTTAQITKTAKAVVYKLDLHRSAA